MTEKPIRFNFTPHSITINDVGKNTLAICLQFEYSDPSLREYAIETSRLSFPLALQLPCGCSKVLKSKYNIKTIKCKHGNYFIKEIYNGEEV